jgi:voltage-gated potassium channel
VVVVDSNHESILRCANEDLPFVEGEASQDEVLRAAGIERAKGLVSAVDSDASNIYVTLSARGLRPDLFIVARANMNGSENKLMRAGADRVLSPYSLGGRRMASLVTRPLVIDFLDTVMHGENVEWLLEQVCISEHSPLAGQTIEEARAKHGSGATILAVRKREGFLVTNPSSDSLLQVGDVLIAIGTPAQLRVLEGLS